MTNFQQQPNVWSCVPTCFAMLLDIPVETIIEEVGHDGSEIIFPDLEEPYCRRGFTQQEMLDVCWKHGYAIVEITKNIVSCIEMIDGSYKTYEVPVSKERFDNYLVGTIGVLTGLINDKYHACVWDGYKLISPDGLFYPLEKIEPMYYWCLIKR